MAQMGTEASVSGRLGSQVGDHWGIRSVVCFFLSFFLSLLRIYLLHRKTPAGTHEILFPLPS